MFIPPQRTFEELSRPAAEAFRFWVSFWPTAPLFGVEWRFADVARTLAPLPAGHMGQEAAAAAKAQKRAVMAVVEAPAVAAPVAEKALTSHPEMVEPAIERTLEPEPKSEPKADAKRKSAPTSEANSAPKSEPKSETRSEPKAEPKAEPKSAPKSEPNSGARSEPKSEVKSEPKSEPKSDPASAPKSKAAENTEPLPVAEPEVSVEEAAARNLTLDLEPGDGAPARPKGLLTTPPKQVDDLKMIKGVGPGLESQLNGLGVYTFRQVAGFSDQDLAWIDANLTSFKGRCFRDDWIGQSKALIEA